MKKLHSYASFFFSFNREPQGPIIGVRVSEFVGDSHDRGEIFRSRWAFRRSPSTRASPKQGCGGEEEEERGGRAPLNFVIQLGYRGYA